MQILPSRNLLYRLHKHASKEEENALMDVVDLKVTNLPIDS